MFLIMLNDHCCVFSYARIFAILWTVARQAALSLGFSQQEYWNGLPFAPPGDPPNLGIEPASSVSPELQVYSLPIIQYKRSDFSLGIWSF